MAPRQTPRPIAITGARSSLGKLLVERLLDHRVPLVALDIEKPPQAVRYYPVNLVEPNCDLDLERALSQEKCRTLVHLAFLSRPVFDGPYSHELQSIGTLNVLHAARSAGVRKIVSVSPAAVYGARGQNPNFLTESHPIRPNREYEYVADRAEADEHVVEFMTKYRNLTVVQLRLAPLVGPNSVSLFTQMLDSVSTPTLLGFDPLFQFLHEDDALEAIQRAIDADSSGIYNIAPEGVVPLSTALYRSGTIAAPIPHPLAYAAYHAAWVTRMYPVPPQHLDYLRYPCVVDGQKACKELGFRPRFTTQGALLEHLGRRRRAA